MKFSSDFVVIVWNSRISCMVVLKSREKFIACDPINTSVILELCCVTLMSLAAPVYQFTALKLLVRAMASGFGALSC